MSPNHNSKSEDFVFIDDPVQVPPLRNGCRGSDTSDYPTDTDYVVVHNDNSIISADEEAFLALLPDTYNEPMVQIEYFEPISLRSFPEEISQTALMAPVPNEHEMHGGELTRSSRPCDPTSRFVNNVILLFECLFHFDSLHPEFNRSSILYTVGKACELRSKYGANLHYHVGRALDALRDSRVAFLQLNKGKFIWRAEDHNVRELARLVDRYISCKREEPREVGEQGYNTQAVVDLWYEWQDVLETKGLRLTKNLRRTKGQRDAAFAQDTGSTGSKRRRLISDAVRAADRLEGALTGLEACGGSDGLTESEKLVIEQALNRATRWTESIQDSHWIDLQPQ